MRRISIFFMLCLMVCCTAVQAQDYSVKFLKGTRQFEPNLKAFSSVQQLQQREIFQNRFYRFVQFNKLPTTDQQAAIAQAGIRLLEYIPNKVYVASIPMSINFQQFQSFNIRSIMPIDATYKMGKRLEAGEEPDWALQGNHLILSIQYYQDIQPEVAKAALKDLGAIVTTTMDHAHLLVAAIPKEQVKALVTAPFIRYADLIEAPGKPESDDGRHLHRANSIDGDYYGARKYDGTGVNIAINDDGFVGPHIDFQGRVNQQDVAGDFTGDHGDMVAGIAGGAGNLDPRVRGMAVGSYMHIRQYTGTMAGTLPLHQDSAVLIFSSSYSNGCNAGYTNTTLLVDQEIYNNPTLMQTFSGGNSNGQDCGYGAGNQWGNITGGHKMGKNVIATANLSNTDAIMNSSSRGPASDGRIKPDISAHGNGQLSTDPNNTYAPGGGTSAAAPGICGVMTQLHHAYRELNGGNTAPSALLKVALLATANDLGNDGPDFIYGWGKVNGLRAAQLLEDNRYFDATVSQGDSNTHSITIPAGVQRAKIMIYWADREASTAAAQALVNDLDATVSDGATQYLPWVLDETPNPANLALPATRGADHLNNVEQIAIDNPAAGTYNLKVKGTTVPFGPQTYYVVYEFLTDEITVIHPEGGEGLLPGETARIHWDAYDNVGTFNIEYTEDNGANWNTINAAVAGGVRILDWTVPNTITGQARVRISRGAVSDESNANFTIMERPENIRVNRVCPGVNTIRLVWDSVPGAIGYDVFMLGATHMDSIGSSTSTIYSVVVNDLNDPQWFSVRATGPNGLRSLRQIAVNYAGSTGSAPVCFLACSSDNDAGITTLTSPGSFLETCAGPINEAVTIELENKGLFTESAIPVYYQLDNNPVVTETFAGSLAPGGAQTYTFNAALTGLAPGVYQFKVWTGLSQDSTSCNDTIYQTITVVDPIATFPYVEDFESGVFPPLGSYLINPDNGRTWEKVITTGAAGGSTTAMRVVNIFYNAAGQEDAFDLVAFDLTQATSNSSAELKFDVAYRRYNANFSDGLRIDISTDCGQTFSPLFAKDGTTLATGADNTGNWQPSAAGDWRSETVDLSTYIGNQVVLRFINECGYGNNLYVDNINVDVNVPQAPSAAFSADVTYTCDGTINFTDESGNLPTQWLWNFGDSTFSTQQNPIHTFASSGVYTVTLQATNATGVGTEVKNAYIIVEYPDITNTIDGEACPNMSVELSATKTTGTLHWYDSSGALIHVGDTFNTPPLTTTTAYDVQNIILTPTLNAGPTDPASVGGGGYHGAGGTFIGAINFTASTDFQLLSVWVDAQTAGPRTITLWDGHIANGGGTPTNIVLQQVTVNLVAGQQRVDLNLEIPGPGYYSIGGNNMDLYRNNSGPSYPYTLPGVVSLVSSTAGTPGGFYYYFYDWALRQDSCAGTPTPINASIVEASFTSVSSGGTAAFTDASTGATSWLWDFGDGNTSTMQNPTHTFTTNGPYLVTLTINNGSCSFSDSVSVSVGIEKLADGMDLVMIPNPATDETTLRFSQVLPEDVTVEVISVDGKILQERQLLAGAQTVQLDVSALPAAMYLVRLRTSEIVDVRKLIVTD